MRLDGQLSALQREKLFQQPGGKIGTAFAYTKANEKGRMMAATPPATNTPEWRNTMKINKLRMLASDKGFTLIELMIVIAIIGILAAVAIPNFIAYRDKSYCSAAEADANSAAATLADYFAIPTHTTMGTLPLTLTTAGGTVNGIKFGPLSGKNTGTIGGGVSAISISVTDGSGRCPKSYQDANPEWKSGVFNKKMR